MLVTGSDPWLSRLRRPAQRPQDLNLNGWIGRSANHLNCMINCVVGSSRIVDDTTATGIKCRIGPRGEMHPPAEKTWLSFGDHRNCSAAKIAWR